MAAKSEKVTVIINESLSFCGHTASTKGTTSEEHLQLLVGRVWLTVPLVVLLHRLLANYPKLASVLDWWAIKQPRKGKESSVNAAEEKQHRKGKESSVKKLLKKNNPEKARRVQSRSC